MNSILNQKNNTALHKSICEELYLNLQLVRRRIKDTMKDTIKDTMKDTIKDTHYKTKIQYINNSTYIKYIDTLDKEKKQSHCLSIYKCYNRNNTTPSDILLSSDILNEREIVIDLNKYCNYNESSSER